MSYSSSAQHPSPHYRFPILWNNIEQYHQDPAYKTETNPKGRDHVVSKKVTFEEVDQKGQERVRVTETETDVITEPIRESNGVAAEEDVNAEAGDFIQQRHKYFQLCKLKSFSG